MDKTAHLPTYRPLNLYAQQNPSVRVGTLTFILFAFLFPWQPIWAQCDAAGCCMEPFDSQLDDSWSLLALGDGRLEFATVSGGDLHLTAAASNLYHDDDNGGFLYRSLDPGDLRIETTLTGMPAGGGGIYQKGGIMLRTGPGADAARIVITLAPNYPDPVHGQGPALQFDVRTEDGGSAVELASTQPGVDFPIDVAIQRRGNTYSVYSRGENETQWRKLRGGLMGLDGHVSLPHLGGPLLAGLVVSSNDLNVASTFTFGRFSECRSQGTVNDPLSFACDPEQGHDFTYLADLSGSSRRAYDHPDHERRIDAQIALFRRLNRSLELLTDGDRGSIVDYSGFLNTLPNGTVIDDNLPNLEHGARISSGFTDDFALLDDLLGRLEADDPVTRSCAPHLRFATCDDDWATDDCCDPTTTSALGMDKVRELLAAEPETGRGAVTLWATDNRPNTDVEGWGMMMTDLELSLVQLRDEFGDFMPPSLAPEARHCFFPAADGLCTDSPVADLMQGIVDLRHAQGDVRIFSILLENASPAGPESTTGSNRELLDFASFYTQGAVLPVESDSLFHQIPVLLQQVHCGETGPGAFDGRVWHDVNFNGRQDPGEPGLAGVRMQAGDEEAITDAEGRYAIVLPPGAYTLEVDMETVPESLRQATIDPDGKSTPGRADLTVSSWTLHDTHFGFGEPTLFCDDFESGGVAAWSRFNS